METATEHAADAPSATFDSLSPAIATTLDPDMALDLHRAINERRAAQENPELLRRIRAL